MHAFSAKNDGEWSIVGKTCLVTGANKGIGYYTALDLIVRGARRVILACRNVDLAQQAVESMRQGLESCPPDQLAIVLLDLASFASVRECARQLMQQERQLHVIVNNAAFFTTDNHQRLATEDGNEMTFQTNHLGHFLLVKLLVPLLERSAPSRIVVVASEAYSFCWPRGLNLNDLNMEQPGNYNGFLAYCQSKLANILYVRQLAKRLDDKKVAVFAVHPGFVRSAAIDRRPRHHHQSRFFVALFETLQRWFAQPTEKGSATSVYCACEPGLEQNGSGGYFSSCKLVEQSRLWAIAKDDAKAEQLWQLSEKMTGDDKN